MMFKMKNELLIDYDERRYIEIIINDEAGEFEGCCRNRDALNYITELIEISQWPYMLALREAQPDDIPISALSEPDAIYIDLCRKSDTNINVVINLNA